MATVENVKLEISASPHKAGCSTIAYSYELQPGDSDRVAGREFTVTVGLWGEDVFADDVLATDLDRHTVQFDPNQPPAPLRVQRSFEVETELLDEDLLGEDEVFLIVEAHAASASESVVEYRVSGKSNIVKGDF